MFVNLRSNDTHSITLNTFNRFISVQTLYIIYAYASYAHALCNSICIVNGIVV